MGCRSDAWATAAARMGRSMQAVSSAPPAQVVESAPRILLVIEDEMRQRALRLLLRGIAPTGQIASDTNAVDALFTAVCLQVELVLIDAALPLGAAGALQRHLERVLPQATVLLLDTPNAPRDPARARLHWTDARSACADWLQTRLGAGAAAHSPCLQRDGP